MAKLKDSVNSAQKIHEEDVLLNGIIRYGKDAYVDCCDIISESHFSNIENQMIYGAISSLFQENQPFSKFTILSKIGYNDSIVKDLDRIIGANCENIDIVRPIARSLRNRKLIADSVNIHRDAINKLYELDDSSKISDILGITESSLFDLIVKASKVDTNPIDFSKVARSIVDEWAQCPVENVGIPLPWPKFNASIGGGLRTGVHLVAARLKVGKTSIGVMVALFAAIMHKIPILIIDTEMKAQNIISRMLANLSEVEINKIERGTFSFNDFEKKQVYNAVSKLENCKISHKHMGGAKFDEILSTIRRWIYTDVGFQSNGKCNPMLVIFDYFKVMDAAELGVINETQALGFQISKLVDMANKYEFPCLSFAQLNRDGISREDSAAVASSDRLAQLANSLSIFKKKTEEEILKDGPQNGNRKLITTDSRYGGEAEFASQYISMNMKKEYCILQEVEFERQQKAEF